MMNTKTIVKSLFVLMCIFLLPAALSAGKIKSSKSYYKNIEKIVKPMDKNLDSLRAILSGIRSPKSFITTDFWGLKPSWYVDGMRAERLTTQYPYAPAWLNRQGIWSKHAAALVRNINGIILSPIQVTSYGRDPKGWRTDLRVEFDFSPGYMDMRSYKRYIDKYLASNGVPSSKMKQAFKYFESKIDPVTVLIEKNVYKRLDRLYAGFTKIGYLRVYRNIAGKLDAKGKLNLDYYFTPNNHTKVFTRKVMAKFGLPYYVKSQKNLAALMDDNIAKMSLFDFYKNSYNLTIAVPLQYFRVAKGLSKSTRFNQLKKLKSMLDKKVATGKVKKTRKGKYTVYEDSFDKYTRGRIGINFKTGVGYWQLPMWNDKKYVDYYISKIGKDVKKTNIAIKKYFAISLDETVKKFQAGGSRTSGF